MKLSLILILFFISINGASAEQINLHSWDFAHEKKVKCSKGNMREMNICLFDEYKKSKTRLNEVYQYLLNALADPLPLVKAQNAWIKFRDFQCNFEVPPSWRGSGVPYSKNACLIDFTERRIKDLERVEPCNGCVEFKPEFY